MIKAFAAFEAGGELKPFEYDPGPIGRDEVEIEVEHCGICHSDLNMIDNDWGMTQYPLVPGHEVVGTISAVGEDVEHLSAGQRVGLGWHSGYCMTCSDLHGRRPQPLRRACRGPSSAATAASPTGCAPMPPASFHFPRASTCASAGPLFCGGITVFNPLVQFDVRPTDKVAVIGIGGLGHIALQFLNAWGCEVTAFTSSEDKKKEALELGAHHDDQLAQSRRDRSGGRAVRL